jgi:acetyltransferase-like isoleucine patch superfamily enzyme
MSNSLDDLAQYFPHAFCGKNVQVCGIRNVSIGAGSCIGDDTWLNVCLRDDKVRLKIGRCVLVGRRNVISTGGQLEIGDYCISAPNVYVGDVNHAYQNDIFKPILLRGTTDCHSLVIEESCWLAMNSVVTGNLTVGRGSVIGANTVVTRDVPPFSVVAGNPGKVIKMFDPTTKCWVATKTEEDFKKILENREKTGIPSREEYRQILASYKFERVDPIVAGGAAHIV